MFYKRIRIVLGITVLLAALLPVQFSVAMQNSQTGKPECPPIDASMLKVPGFLKSLPARCRAELKEKHTSQQQAINTTSILATGGPDDFGYTFDDTVPFNWISATNDSGVSGDESYSQPPFDIGFSFPFYGLQYSQLLIHTNGFLTFDPIITCCFWTSSPIPNPALPNNYIASFWDDLLVGAPYNSGAIYYEKGGVAPDRFLVVEWRDVTTYLGSDPFSFEVVLYESGNILVQVQSLPASYFATVGIENNVGDDGLGYYHGDTGLSAPKAILFTHPTGPIARVSVSPGHAGKFAGTGSNTNFPISILNLGTAGTDTYNLSITSSWVVNLYQDGCVTPLTDTNADAVIDTGPLPEGASTMICVSFTTPAGASVGDGNSAGMTVTSSIDPTKMRDVLLDMAVAAPFVQIFEDYANAAIAFQIHGPEGPTTNYVTDDSYFANGIATMRMPDGRYIYAWRKPGFSFPSAYSNIEFTLLNADGSFSLPVTQLTNNIGTGETYDYDPAVAVAPNGNIGVTWRRTIFDTNTFQANYNMFFAVLSHTGTLLYGPTNITNNSLWDNFDNYDVPHFFDPAIAATDDERFVVSWQEYRTNGSNINHSNIWYAVREFDGAQVLAPTALTNNNFSFTPILNPLTDGRVILTFLSSDPFFAPYFAVLRSDGTVSKPATSLDNMGDFSPWSTPDAVVLSNGTVAVAWPADSGVALDILDASSYDVTTGPLFGSGPNVPLANSFLSVTSDASDRIIMTWAAGDGDPPLSAFYALADNTGTFITNPMPFWRSTTGTLLSENGQGNAPIISESPVMDVDIDIVPGSSLNIVSPKMPYVPVAILSADGFDAVSDVDRSSLTFGKTGDEASLFLCFGKGADVNSDGRRDLICLFRFSVMGIASGDTQGILSGQTLDGAEFEGMDALQVSPMPTK